MTIRKVWESDDAPTVEMTISVLNDIKFNKWREGLWTGVGITLLACVILAIAIFGGKL